MKQLLFISFIIVCKTLIAQNICNGLWKIESNFIVRNTDTAYLFRNNTDSNYFNLSKITYSFNNNLKYQGISIDGTSFIGNWRTKANDSIYIDDIGSKFYFTGSDEFIIYTPFQIQDTSGNIASAVSFLKFYNIPITEFKFIVSPNPFNDFVDIQIESPESFSASITVVNTLGEKLFSLINNQYSSYNKLSINLSYLPRGIYYISILHGKDIETRKIVKN